MSFLNNKRRVLQNTILFGKLKSQHDWLLCRKIIVFSGSLLTLIYGLAILTVIQWIKVESIKLSEPLSAPDIRTINNYFFTSFIIVVIGMIGSISPFIKSNETKASPKSCDTNNNVNNKTIKRVNSYITSQSSRNNSTFIKSIQNWIKISPLFSLNAILYATIIPIEFTIALNTCKLLGGTDDSSFKIKDNYYMRAKEEMNRLYICLITLYFCIIMIQICVLLYIIDLLQSYVNDNSFPIKMSPLMRNVIRTRAQNSLISCNPRIEQKHRLQSEKNLQFLQFHYQENSLPESPLRSPAIQRQASKASTIAADQVFPRQSSSSEPSFNEYSSRETGVRFDI